MKGYNNFFAGNICLTATSLKILITIILLLQAVMAIQASQLMRSGDVEQNPGPGRYSGECVETVVDGGGTCSIELLEYGLQELFSSQKVY